MKKKRLKLCVMVPAHWAASMGGSQYQAKILIEMLVKMDIFDIMFLARKVNPSYQPIGYSVLGIGGGTRWGGTYLQDAPGIWRSLRRMKPDVIYQRVGCSHTGVAALYARTYGKRLVWHVASDVNVIPDKPGWSWSMPLKRLEQWLFEYGIRKATDIVVQTKEQAELLHKNFGRSASAIVANFHPEPLECCDKPRSPVKVCWIANIKPLKRPEMFVQLAEDLQKVPNVEFVMIGKPSQGMPGWGQLMDRVGKLTNLTYLGLQAQDTVNKVLAESHIFINTSEYEGFANTFIQAWMRGAPVLSLSVNPDNIFDDKTLGICAGGNFDQLRSELIDLINDEERRRRMELAVKLHARKNHGEENAAKLISLLTGRRE